MNQNKYQQLLNQLIDTAFAEDIAEGDHTSLACVPADAFGKARLIVKDQGVIAGIAVAARIFQRFDSNMIFTPVLNDGDWVRPGDIAFYIEGSSRSILQAERLVLNVMQRMSGIASETRKYADRIKEFPTRILDTRKTTPGMRILDKEAVKIGGGENHRMGLYDMIMIKDNHSDFAGGVQDAIRKVQRYLLDNKLQLKIEVEARSLHEIDLIMEVGGIHRIMLDNFNLATTREAVAKIGGKYETESSGGITLDTLADYAACGVDFISVGAITHQVKSLDLSLKAC